MTTATTSARPSNTRPAIAAILAISAAATLFLFWLIYVHPASDAGSTRFAFLPALNAILNGLSCFPFDPFLQPAAFPLSYRQSQPQRGGGILISIQR